MTTRQLTTHAWCALLFARGAEHIITQTGLRARNGDATRRYGRIALPMKLFCDPQTSDACWCGSRRASHRGGGTRLQLAPIDGLIGI